MFAWELKVTAHPVHNGRQDPVILHERHSPSNEHRLGATETVGDFGSSHLPVMKGKKLRVNVPTPGVNVPRHLLTCRDCYY